MIDQVTVFLENSEGRLAAMCRCLADANVNMKALTIAESSDFGLVRIVCADPQDAVAALNEGDFRASTTKVSAIAVPDRAGGLADLMNVLDDMDLNIEYGYCFIMGDSAVDVFKINGDADAATAAFKLEESGFKVLKQADLA